MQAFSYFNLENKLLRQFIETSMGSDSAPYLKNKIKKTDIRRARRFVNTFKFCDDLTVLNDGGKFERSFREIYPATLELKKETDFSKETGVSKFQ